MRKVLLAVLLTMLATPALAHTGHGDASGFAHGFAHPFFGTDHLLAMLAVGLWSGFVLQRRFWLGAATFMAAMSAGAALSWIGIAIPMVETWILISVIVFGLLSVVSRSGQAEGLTRASFAAIALFALCHGHAHATEATGDVTAYLAGFLTATAVLHMTGIVLARGIASRVLVQRAAGLGIAASGIFLMMG
jgi:urease accessory protein